MSEDLNGERGLHPCRNPACRRLVSSLSYFCCAPCNDADYGKYEVHAHSAGCDERDAERRADNGGSAR